MVDREGARIGSFGEFPGAELFIGRVAGLVLFGANTFVAVVDDQLVIGTAKESELRYYGSDGQLRRVVRWPDHARRVTPERIEQFVEFAVADMPEEKRTQARQVFEEVPKSDMQPAFEHILTSPNGELWVGEYRGPESALPDARSPAREWLVFKSNGIVMARVATPAGFQPMFVGTDDIVGVFIDELGVESIQSYEVLRKQGGSNGV